MDGKLQRPRAQTYTEGGKVFYSPSPLLTPIQIERRTGIPASTIKNYLDRGLLPSVKVGPARRAWRRVRLRDVVQLVREKEGGG